MNGLRTPLSDFWLLSSFRGALSNGGNSHMINSTLSMCRFPPLSLRWIQNPSSQPPHQLGCKHVTQAVAMGCLSTHRIPRVHEFPSPPAQEQPCAWLSHSLYQFSVQKQLWCERSGSCSKVQCLPFPAQQRQWWDSGNLIRAVCDMGWGIVRESLALNLFLQIS